jgi:hypothetical protein
MKKFTLSRVLDGFRSSVNQGPGQGGSISGPSGKNQEGLPLTEIVETLKSDNFQISQVSIRLLFSHFFPWGELPFSHVFKSSILLLQIMINVFIALETRHERQSIAPLCSFFILFYFSSAERDKCFSPCFMSCFLGQIKSFIQRK